MISNQDSLDDTTGKGILLKADGIADTFRAEVKVGLAACSHPPKLVGILSTSSQPSRMYAMFTKKQCEELGFEFVLRTVGAAESSELGEGEGVEEAIIEANEDESVDGIMVYYPIFGVQQDHYLQQVASPIKDVEGLNVKFHYNLYHKYQSASNAALPAVSDDPPPGTVKSILPCTPLAIVKCLENIGVYNTILKYGDRAYGKIITVVNRSEVVGRPLAALLANDGARVFSVDIDSIQEYTKRPSIPTDSETGAAASIKRRYHPHHVVRPSTKSLEDCLAISDVVISAVPSPSYKIKTAWLKDGCVCVNVASEKNFEKDVREKASIYLPAVGKVTILMLLRNL
ncbi:NAD-binding protein [Fomitiporia mediterranea MF3/22]|uniref:NAD-binding protein n=1 Tax=Fomitiporia mediterranea (strain MF3/22) TaxID=694068 RepID=UPI0004407FFB|nr:NAD-binding protein [Fomitiporia mediterranea MF3/22]EJD01549.1 NAD-binding protein [Fomitiporia mediterranea MF3/22]